MSQKIKFTLCCIILENRRNIISCKFGCMQYIVYIETFRYSPSKFVDTQEKKVVFVHCVSTKKASNYLALYRIHKYTEKILKLLL